MFKKITLTTLLLGVSYAATADWVGGISYHRITEKSDGVKIGLGAMSGSLGHKILIQDQIYIIPEVRVGLGVQDDSFDIMGIDVGVEVDGFLSLSLKGQMEVDNNLYAYIVPSYANFNVTTSVSGYGQDMEVTEDSWHFGLGAGLGYRFNQERSVELAYEKFDDVEVMSAGLKFNF